MMEAAEAFAASMFTQERWPFWSTVLVLTIIGQFTSTKLFTRARAYAKTKPAWKQHFWWWSRETLMLHPIAAGFVLGLFWADPESQGWPKIASQMYFAAAGGVSLVAWTVLKGVLKKRGINVELPGASKPPSS